LHHILQSAPHLIWRVFLFFFCVETLFAALLFALIYTSIGEQYSFGSFTLLWILHTAKYIFEMYILFKLISSTISVTRYISGYKLTVFRGLVSQSEKVYDLNQLKNIEIRQTWLGRNLHYGDIHLTLTSSGFSEIVILENVQDSRKYERFLRDTFLHS
jgi:uncharacterized membrane protein YdbT with pleckstrin-like domain